MSEVPQYGRFDIFGIFENLRPHLAIFGVVSL
jgi:hypothetical protein